MATPTYTTLTRIEIGLLLEHKAPRCCFPVISAINSYMFDTCNSFPSVQTIIEWLGGHISKSGVEKALRWLEKHNIITRGKARTKTRFTNMIRKKVYGTMQKGKECLQSVSKTTLTECKHKENKPEENNSTPFIPPKDKGEEKRHRKRSVESRLMRAKRRVQNYTNLLNNREIETPNDKVWEEEAKSIWSFWLAMGQMGAASQIKPTQDDAENIRKLRRINDEVNTIIQKNPVFQELLKDGSKG